jgi:ribosomal protein L33
MKIINPKDLNEVELKSQISKVNYYIASNNERGNSERVTQLKDYKQQLKLKADGKI